MIPGRLERVTTGAARWILGRIVGRVDVDFLARLQLQLMIALLIERQDDNKLPHEQPQTHPQNIPRHDQGNVQETTERDAPTTAS